MRATQVRSILALLAVPVVGAWLVVAAGTAGAAVSTTPIDIVFDHDSTGSKAQPFRSVDSAAVGFDVVQIGDPTQCAGSPCPYPTNDPFDPPFLAVQDVGSARMLAEDTMDSDGALRMTFTRPTQTVRVTYYFFHENDQFRPAVTAALTGYRQGAFVTQVTAPIVAVGSEDTLAIQGYVIDSAVLQFVQSTGRGAADAEYVDELRSDPLCSKAGGAGNDSLTGTAGVDVLCGGPGNDTIHGAGGNDLIFGDLGNDHLFGDAGKDTLRGGLGTDSCNGGAGTDSSIECESRTSIP
jgi:hypothetical protein